MTGEERELQARSAVPRLFQLDALRGLAAVTVVLHHCRLMYHDTEPGFPLALIVSGHSAVVLFFVLSGYVLSVPYWKGRRTPYVPYLVRRFFRIYVPYFIALLLAVPFALHFLDSPLPLTAFFYRTWHTPVTATLLVKQVLMWPSPELNTAFWSLRYEVQLSILFPFLCAALRRTNPAALCLVLFAAVFGSPDRLRFLEWHMLDITAQVVCFFALGAVLARYAEPLRRRGEALGPWLLPVLAASLFLYLGGLDRLTHGKLHAEVTERSDMWIAFGSAGILVCSLCSARFARILRHPLPEYLGRISYSLYLTHGTVLFALVILLTGHLPVWAILLLVLVGSFALAHGYCVLVEEPAMRLGRRLGSPAAATASAADRS